MKRCIVLFITFCCAVVSNAQTNGIVTDGEKGLPLACLLYTSVVEKAEPVRIIALQCEDFVSADGLLRRALYPF